MTKIATACVAVAVAAAAIAAGATGVAAMPLEQDFHRTHGVTTYGTLDIREVRDDSSEMDVRLTQQIMVLQQQILKLQQEMAAMQAKMPQ